MIVEKQMECRFAGETEVKLSLLISQGYTGLKKDVLNIFKEDVLNTFKFRY
jgi:hypothetical protein